MEKIEAEGYDAGEVVRAVRYLKDKEEVVEVRIPNAGKLGTVSGYFDDPRALARAVGDYDGEHPIYLTLNPVAGELLARAENRLEHHAQSTTSSGDIERRKWLLVDLDPVRPSGISATDGEREKALERAREMAETLGGEGWPSPALATSGNGAHLLYRVDLPCDSATKELVKKALGALDLRFSTGEVKVDSSTAGAAHLTRLYGTLNPKGDSTEERPHRRSGLIEAPEKPGVLSREELEGIAEILPDGGGKPKNRRSGGGFEIEEWIDEHGLEVAKSAPWNGGEKFVLSECPWDSSHTDNSAYIVRFESGAIAAGCHHDSCSEEDWESLKEEVGFESGPDIPAEEGEEKQADKLIRLASGAEIYQDEVGDTYAVVEIEGHREVLRVDGERFGKWLVKMYYDEERSSPGKKAQRQAVQVLESQAEFGAEERSFCRRVAEAGDGSFYYDLGDEDWKAVKITPDGPEIDERPPAVFVRSGTMEEQAEPEFPGDLSRVLDFVNLQDEDDRLLYQVYLVTCLVPGIPHPVLVLHGAKGSAKSTLLRVTRKVVDPAGQELLTMPNGRRDLVVALTNNYLTSFDNMEKLSKSKSNLLCQASTGGAISLRKLYTDADDKVIEFQRCVALNGINMVTTEPDLLDRSLIFELERLGDGEFREESKLWEEFEKARPTIVGGALTALSGAMELYHEVEPGELGRMADFARWGYAAAEALGLGGDEFLAAYRENQSETNEAVVSSHPVAAAVRKLMEGQEEESGMVSEMLKEMEKAAAENRIDTNDHLWPGAANVLSKRLKEVKSNLEDAGITYSIRKGSDGKILTFRNEEEQRKAEDKESSGSGDRFELDFGDDPQEQDGEEDGFLDDMEKVGDESEKLYPTRDRS
ncbi:hypothetical protein [Halarsenatibacter silvermanii]|uniref:Bifunctional DNA primase/polymerase, N-terminal n=1 Tax=Halarsenatibacter silvermanii TaxID=321763 RepID=A0A1G9HQJ2_9FIRM|nr:hypothetical protein [Halarsenatibacter silvermanii]SDL15220.1 hypothetical protein SAMN04488692_1027 [Halarsenatibacter silvermanii]